MGEVQEVDPCDGKESYLSLCPIKQRKSEKYVERAAGLRDPEMPSAWWLFVGY